MTIYRPRTVLAMIAALLVVAALVVAGAGPAEAAGKRSRSCQTAGTTVAANEHLRLFKLMGPSGNDERFLACPRGARRGRYLTTASLDATDLPVSLGGRFAIYAYRRCQDYDDGRSLDPPGGDRDCRGGIAVYDSRRNSIRRAASAENDRGELPYVIGFVVNTRGWSGWVEPSSARAADQSVWVMAPGGAPRKVAETTEGDYADAFEAVAINEGRLFWSIGGVAGSVRLRR